MNCREIRVLSHAYADRELDVVRAAEFEQHLSGCRSCSRELQEIRSLSSALKASTFYFRAPANLQNRIRQSTCARNGVARLKARSIERQASWKQWMRWFMPVAASAIVVLLAIFAAFNQGVDNRLTEEVVSSHIRSRMAEHLTDVASTEQHTVKPWFAARVDFAPPVTDLKEHGFPLQGGRLDYLQNRVVAAEVYKRNDHVINLFVWPASGNRNTIKKLSVAKGYNVISWENSGMNYAAVSELNPVELREFADLLK
jgi:anti-sigma factor RsiW